MYIYSPGTYGSASGFSIDGKAFQDYGIYRGRLLQINVTKCNFTNANSFSGGGAMYIKTLKASVRLRHSELINCTCAAENCGAGGVLINTSFASPKGKSDNDLVLVVESCRFIGCKSRMFDIVYSGCLSVLFNTAEVKIRNNHFVSNHGGVINLQSFPTDKGSSKKPSYVTVGNSMFLNNYGWAINALFAYKQSVLILKNVTIK